MKTVINTKELRATLSQIVERVRGGEQFTVLYRSRPAFRIVPIDEESYPVIPLEKDPLYQAGAVGESTDGLSSKEHDAVLYWNGV
ncbi:MAG: type II toxin-antitoxin system prevent-host-death family antitoxin [Deltaproteobacteria bacterium]|nr:type II toxin-antitoxin system prevent-host-death family antitoxin [Deltaproteobacteria bacterium]